MAVPRLIAPGLFTDGVAPRLLAARCPACTKLHFPATESCPYCSHFGCEPVEVGPTGSLYLFTVITNAPPGYRGPLPYGFGVVELPEGLRVVTCLTEHDLSRLRPGLAMRLVVEPLYVDAEGAPVLSYAFSPNGRTPT